MAYRIKLMGRPAIIDAAGESRTVRGHQAWALLARLVLAQRPLARAMLAQELFAETVDPLGALRWCLAALRKALDASDCLVGDPIELRLPEGTKVDVHLLADDALATEEMDTLLSGLEPQCSPEFATWLLVERARIGALIDGRIRREVMHALALDDCDRAVPLAERAVSRDAFNESAHILLVKSLALTGKMDAALEHVAATERLFAAELGTAPSPALRSAARPSVSALPGGIAPEAHARSLLRAGGAALAAGAVDAGIDALRQAMAAAEETADHHLFAETMLALGKGLVHAIRGFDDEGAVLLRRCTESARSRGYERIACAGFRELGYVEALAGRRPAAAEDLKTAEEFARSADDLASVHAVIGFNLVDWGKVESGLERYAVALDEARSAGNRHSEIWALGIGARGQLAAGRLDEAEAWLRHCLDLIDETHWVSFRPWPVAVLGEVRLSRRGAPAAVRASLEEAYALGCQLRDPCWEAATARVLALCHAAEGDLETAESWLDDGYRRCMRETDPYAALSVEILASRVEINQKLGRPEIAATLAREWVAAAARAHMDGHVARAAAFLARAA